MPAPAVIGKTEIITKALLLVAQVGRFSDYDGDNQTQIDMRTLWDIAVPAALVKHPWNFAIRRKRILPDTAKPDFGYAFQYRVPLDCLRWLPWARGEDDHFEGEREGAFILTDQDGGINVRYIFRQDDLSTWSGLFADALAAQLALEYANAKGQSVGVIDRIDRWQSDKLAEAKRADALENGNRRQSRVLAVSRWAGARFRSRGYGVR